VYFGGDEMLRAEIEKYVHIMLKAIFFSAIVLLVCLILKLLFAYFMPFIIAFVIALIIEPVVSFFQKFKIGRGFSVLISLILFLGGFVAVSVFAVTRIVYELTELYDMLPKYYDKIYSFATNIIQRATDLYFQLTPEVINIIQDSVKTVFGKITSLLSLTTNALINVVTVLPSILIFLLITLISTFFLTKDKYIIRDFIFRQLPDNWNTKLTSLKNDLFIALIGFIKAQSIILTVTFIESYIGLTIIGIDYAFIIAIIIALVDILPVLGTGSIYVPWAIISFSLGNYRMAISLIVLYGIITVVRYMIEPKVVGKQLGIHPLVALMSMFVGLKLIGVAGVILGPTAVVTLKACQHAGILPKFK